MKFLCKVRYNGQNYQGWQKQPNVLTIQEVIENSLSKLCGSEIKIFGSGRTDSGVHALGQTFHFEVKKLRYTIKNFLYHLNCMLPDDIDVISMRKVSDDFHARFNAKGKIYQYRFNLEAKNPFEKGQTFLCFEKVDVAKIKECISLFVGQHDFKDFTSKEEDKNNFIREIYSFKFVNKNGKYFEIYGNGFMRYQIRFMVGAIFAVITGKEDVEFIKKHLANKREREIISYKSPSDGLYLKEVIY